MTFSDLLAGDLLFMKDFTDFSKAITGIQKDSKYSHVGIYFGGMIYHASFTKGVIKEPLSEFIKSENKEIFVYRYDEINEEKVLNLAEKYLGLPYNFSFYPDGEGLYCSQYISKILPIFETVPMKFCDENKKISDYWKEYYNNLGVEVPLDVEGTNPNQLSESEKIRFVGKLEL